MRRWTKNTFKHSLLVSLVWVLWCLTNVADAAVFQPLDPSSDLGGGVETIGQGGASVATWRGANGVFLNPSLSGGRKSPYLTVLATANLRTVNQTLVGAVTPLPYGSLGIGYLTTNRPSVGNGGILRDDQVLTDGGSSYFSNVLALSFGSPTYTRLDTFSSLYPFRVGGTLKYFSQGFRAGSSIDTSLTATGFDVDLGVQVVAQPYLRVGLSAQNILPKSAGGQLHWSDGTSRGVPARVVVGSALDFVGENGFLLHHRTANWKAELDLVLPKGSDPLLARATTLWSPWPLWDVFAGYQQTVEGTTQTNFVSLGTTLRRGPMAFHYVARTEASTVTLVHTFSFSYDGTPQEQEKQLEKQYINLKFPQDKTVVREPWVLIRGEVLQGEIIQVLANDQPLTVTKNRIEQSYPLPRLGKNRLVLQARSPDGDVLYEHTIRLVRLASFPDVSEKHWAKNEIEQVATVGWLRGYPGGVFRPEQVISQGELAHILAQVQSRYGAEEILSFFSQPRAAAPATRGEGVAIVVRALSLWVPSAYPYKPFPDLPQQNPYFSQVYAAKEAGLLDYLSGEMFDATQHLTRAEVATMLAKSPAGRSAIDTLFDWTYAR